MKVKIKKLSDKAVLPKQGSTGAAGFDLLAISAKEVESHGLISYIEYDTGLAVQIPKGFVGYLFPRSSISNKGLSLANSVGVIDSDYTGPIKLRMYSTAVSDQEPYKAGERVAQLIIMPIPDITFEEVDELSTTDRADGGFGSTGK